MTHLFRVANFDDNKSARAGEVPSLFIHQKWGVELVLRTNFPVRKGFLRPVALGVRGMKNRNREQELSLFQVFNCKLAIAHS
jgi:hypothetical protein